MLSACQQKDPKVLQSGDTGYISFSRGPCYGLCPVYSVEIQSDGQFTFHGKENTKVLGIVEKTLSKEKYQQVIDLLNEKGFLNLNSEYTHHDVTDHSSVSIEYFSKNESKKVAHYLGDKSAPQSLLDIETKLDQILETQQYILSDVDAHRADEQ